MHKGCMNSVSPCGALFLGNEHAGMSAPNAIGEHSAPFPVGRLRRVAVADLGFRVLLCCVAP